MSMTRPPDVHARHRTKEGASRAVHSMTTMRPYWSLVRRRSATDNIYRPRNAFEKEKLTGNGDGDGREDVLDVGGVEGVGCLCLL